MHKFDYAFLKKLQRSIKVYRLFLSIGEQKAIASGRKKQLSGCIFRVGADCSCSVGQTFKRHLGIVTSERRIREIVNNSCAPLNHDEAKIAGYRDTLNLIRYEYKTLDLSKEDVLKLHSNRLQVWEETKKRTMSSWKQMVKETAEIRSLLLIGFKKKTAKAVCIVQETEDTKYCQQLLN